MILVRMRRFRRSGGRRRPVSRWCVAAIVLLWLSVYVPPPRAGLALAAVTSPDPALDDAAFEIPDFLVAPSLSPLPGVERARGWGAVLTFGKTDGREVGPWFAELYLPEGDDDPRALVVILPVGGARSRLADRLMKRFVAEDFATLLLRAIPETADQGVMHSLRGTARTLAEDAANLLRVVRWARTLPGVDPARVGVLGVSRGAIGAALAAQQDRSLSVVLVLGGADLVGLLRESRLDVVERLRRGEIERAGGDVQRMEARAAQVLANVDPLSRPGRLDPSRTLLINARWDRVIPHRQGIALREAAGGATQAWLATGHYGTVLRMRTVRRLAVEHFTRTLGGSGLR